MSPLPPEKRDKLTKMMQLAQSENDSEALAALRKANKLLADNNLNWERLFNAIDDRRIIAWENDYGGTTFRPHASAFDVDCESPKRFVKPPPPVINLPTQQDK